MRAGLSALVAAFALALAREGAAAEPTVDACIAAARSGQVDRDEGRYVSARQAFVTCGAPSCPAAVRGECLKWLNEIDVSVPTVVFVVRDAAGQDVGDVVVKMDGAVIASRLDGRPIAVDPGEHAFAFEAGARRVEGRAIVHVGEQNRIVRVKLDGEGAGLVGPDALPAPSPAPRPFPLVPALLGGAAIVSIGASLFLWSGARSDLTSLEASACASTRTCAESDVQSIRTRLVVGDVLAGVALVAAGAAVWLWLSRDRPLAVGVRGPTLLLGTTF